MAAAKKQIITNQYLEPFKANKRKVIGLAVELDENGKRVDRLGGSELIADHFFPL